MILLLSTAEAAAAKMPLSVAVAATLLSCCLHAACAGAEEPRVVCPMANVVREHTKFVTVPVIEVAEKPLPTIRLSTYTSTTTTTTTATLTSTTCLIRNLSVNTSTIEVFVTSVVTTHKTLTVTQVTPVLWPVTLTTTALTTTTATRHRHATTNLDPPPLPPAPVETVVESRTMVISRTAAVSPLTRIVTNIITYTVCPAELFIK
ncbi:probable transcription-associated protein 1 isoform X2 [Eriocheir sinensis]|uniref:probable transcription-associated protein 1 isoform X2 n=1 Tax=Eriocheir sinensis TaxID=95602 RepID=UPI0021C64B70|nr:probable transcription-associated protein 1 isoform X2 [Eriocheir sinensis]